jgi:glycosyltransferase involved in cell wall biosynthesis
MNDRIPTAPPQIKPIVDSNARPLWSVMIPTYNCSRYLKETLQSVLIQAGRADEMQISVIDDCSTDDNVEDIVKEVGKGRINFFRQAQNVGSLRNFETCINSSLGQLVHILHGDDLVKPGFYSEIENLFEKHPSIGAAFTGLTAIDEKNAFVYHNNHVRDNPGIIDDWLLTIAEKQRLQVCAMVVKRSVYEELGSFCSVHYGEDWEMWARIATKFQVAYSPKDLALYRVHDNNISTRFLSTGQNIKDIKTVIDTIQNYLPVENRKEIKKISSRIFAHYFSNNAHKIYKVQRNKSVALKQARTALLLSFNKYTLKSLLKLYAKVLINYRGNG